MEFTKSDVRAANRGFADALADPAASFAADFPGLFAQPVDMVKRNVWGDDIALVDTREFCAQCEHTHGGHYTNCPRYRVARLA